MEVTMGQIKNILMTRDDMTADEADELIQEAKDDLYERLANNELPEDICQEWFGLEPDYMMEILDF